MNKQQFIDLIVKNHNSGDWLNSHFQVELSANGETVNIGVKAYGKWVQVMQLCGMSDGTACGVKTVKGFRAEVENLVNGLLRACAYEVKA